MDDPELMPALFNIEKMLGPHSHLQEHMEAMLAQQKRIARLMKIAAWELGFILLAVLCLLDR